MKKHYPYRFKIETEFIKEFGENWHFNSDNWDLWISGSIDWISSMDYLFGISYPYFVDKNKLLPKLNGWSISWNMLTEIKPDYTPRRKKK